MGRLPLTLACDAYDRTVALRTGDVRVDGADLNYLCLPVEETFYRMVRYREFDAAELSLSTYVLTLNSPEPPFIAIPAFPSRSFRHNGIYVNTAAGITGPADLAGRLVGVPEYQVTAAVWIRGILAERHGLPVSSVRYRTGGLHAPGRVEKVSVDLPPDVSIEPIPAARTLADMLVTGEIEALYTPRTPAPFAAGRPEVGHLFADPAGAEQDYYRDTGIFPIMHVVVLRRDFYEANRWVARSLFDAFERARRQALATIDETAALRSLLPWGPAEVARTRALMGQDWWTYGLPGNETVLSTFLRYSHAQGLASRLWDPRDLFAPECLDQVVV